MSKLSTKTRNALIAKAAVSLARDHLAPPKPKRRRGRKLLLGGVLAALGAGLLLKRDKVLALLPGRSEDVAAPPAPASGYGPAPSTATPVPDPVEIDEAAEEAADIGGPAPHYAAAAEPTQPVPEPERPLAEAGEGESEWQEQAEADLADTVTSPQSASGPAPAEERPAEGPPSEWRTWSGRSVNP